MCHLHLAWGMPVMLYCLFSYPTAFPSDVAASVLILGCYGGFADVAYLPFSAVVAKSSGFSRDSPTT